MTSQTLNYKNYIGSVEVDLKRQRMHGKILYINDLITYVAESPAELEKAFRESVDDYLETCAELGIPPKQSFSGTFNVRVGEELHSRAAHCATELGQTLNEFVCNAVRHSVERAEADRSLRNGPPRLVIVKNEHTASGTFDFSQMAQTEEVWEEKWH